ncbi:MAG: glycosyltransferase [Clostridia bacterium]|nr:glycosyltransferase [Clostridia bacterium]
MENNINHTFAICAYKESKYLEECIKSIINQKVKSNVIMSTSTPNEYITSLADKYHIKLYINNGKKGIGEDWNFAVSKTDTDYVTIIHQDDVYSESYLEKIMERISNSKREDIVILFTKYQEIKEGKVINLTKNLKIKEMLLFPLKFFKRSKFFKKIALAFGNSICCPSVTLNTKIVGKTPYKTGMKSNIDWDTWLACIQYKGSFEYIPEYLMFHRIHEESETSATIESNKRLEEDYQMFLKFWPKVIAKMLMRQYKNAINTNK